jgi:hypothetical protein
VEVIIAAVAVTVVLFAWVSWTVTRLDRLHGRTALARSALDSALVRRAAALQALASHPDTALGPKREARLLELAAASLDADDGAREAAENDLSRALRDIPAGADPALLADLTDAARRVALARRFYNDAVRDTRTLRGRRMPRLLHLAGHREMPAFFDIDETLVFADRIRPARTTAPHEEATS